MNLKVKMQAVASAPFIINLRQGLWHFRRGGLSQLQDWRERHRAETVPPRKIGNTQSVIGHWTGRGERRELHFVEAALPQRAPKRGDIHVATILDEFSELAFSYEWNQVAVPYSGWKDAIDWTTIDLLFIESAWAGNSGQWKGKLSGTNSPSTQLSELIDFAKNRGVPTVFWNKEDPPHYSDFLEAARLCDVVFTSDENMVPRYRHDLKHSRIYPLTFAAQPAIHNPVRPKWGFRARDVVFAGMYFQHKYKSRGEQVATLLDGAQQATVERPLGLEIFSRHKDSGENYRFPAQFVSRVVGELNYREMISAYKAYKVILNVNSVTDSPTMCSRRVFESIASGAQLVTTGARSLENLFGDQAITVVDTPTEAAAAIEYALENPDNLARENHRAQRQIWERHTYTHRADTVLAKLTNAGVANLSHGIETPSVSVVLPSIRPELLKHALGSVARQRVPQLELIYLTHGFTVSAPEAKNLKSEFQMSNLQFVTADADTSLGELLNLGVVRASGDIVAKMDDDDYYGEHYLSDLLHAQNFSGADVVGKLAHYVYLEQRDLTVLRFADKEHRMSTMVMGPTITANREVFREYPFTPLRRGEDTDFLRRVRADGLRTYSSDRFNFVQRRRNSGHTWEASDAAIVKNSQNFIFGNYSHQISI